ncbi:MAG TPA: methyltransferase [Flexivirga sp.]|uniref:RraA family protein n=1 Tax=Flexivirga sp. TaxID=1962927 RepID=UPI002CC01646|nr:methyltransferase [Flexivirga sp.]HWC22317.1 methyltransferase [Flexivirga sp.]
MNSDTSLNRLEAKREWVRKEQDEISSLIETLKDLPAAVLGDVMNRMGLLASAIHPVWSGAHVVGRALTVWTRAGDNRAIHDALQAVQPHDVIVVDGQGDESRALIGELMGLRARVAGATGYIIDGAVRDVDGLATMNMPVFARAITPAGPFKTGPGGFGCPISVGGVVVSPGDYVVGDSDGVAVIPAAAVARVIEDARAKVEREARTFELLTEQLKSQLQTTAESRTSWPTP